MLGVGDRVADDVLEEDLEDAARLLVDEARDTLDTATASETADGRLGDALDVVAKLCGSRWGSAPEVDCTTRRTRETHDLAVTLGAALAETLSALATARHCARRRARRVSLGGVARGAGEGDALFEEVVEVGECVVGEEREVPKLEVERERGGGSGGESGEERGEKGRGEVDRAGNSQTAGARENAVCESLSKP